MGGNEIHPRMKEIGVGTINLHRCIGVHQQTKATNWRNIKVIIFVGGHLHIFERRDAFA